MRSPIPVNSTATADEFIAAMAKIWEAPEYPVYGDWKNAADVARAIGAKQVGHPASSDRDDWATWRLPNGERVRISVGGSAVSEMAWVRR